MCAPAWAAQIIRYVDPDATGAEDGTSWTDAYQTLNEWEGREAVDLDAANNYMTVYLRSSGGTADPNYVDLFGWTTSETDYIEIIQDDTPTDGIYDATKYRMTNSSSSDTLAVREGWVHVHGLQIVMSHTGTTQATAILTSAAPSGSVVYFDSCIIKMVGTTSGNIYGFYIGTNGAGSRIYNCTIHGNAQGYGVWGSLGTTAIWNSTIYNWGTGVYDQAGYLQIINTAIGQCGNDISGGDLLENNLTNDNDGDSPQIPLSQDWDNEFVDANNGDFHLVTGGNAIGNGQDDLGAGVYIDDIRGVLRTSTWDIGAYEIGDDPGAPTGPTEGNAFMSTYNPN